MKRTALVAKGRVQSIVMTDAGYKPPKGSVAIESETANIGDKHDGENFLVQTDVASVSKQDLIDYAHFRRAAVAEGGIDFNLAQPGDSPKIVKIPTDSTTREEIRELAWVAEINGENATLVTKDGELKFDRLQIMTLRGRIAKHIAHSHRTLGKVIEAIDSGRIAFRRDIDAPEKLKLPPWRAHHDGL